MKPLATLLSFVVVSTLLTPSAHADRKTREEEKARQQRLERQLRDVEYILKHESDGTLSDRKAALAAMISTGIAPDEAYWQAGYIKRGDEWVSVGDRWLTSEQEQKLEEYNKARFNYASDDEGNYKLAQWCAENELDAQAYGHLKAVLVNNPDHEGLRQMLGYQKIGHRWMNAEEFDVAVREADRLVKELQEWGSQIAEIREGLNSRVKQKQTIARNQLKEIKDVAAIPALELILLPSSDICAAACVEQLCAIDHRRSSIALCKAAMFLPDSSSITKQAAIEELKTRPLEDFVPVLLGKMQTPLMVQCRIIHESGWEFSHGPFNLSNKYTMAKTQVLGKFLLKSETMYELRNHAIDLIFVDFVAHADMVVQNGAEAWPYWHELNRKIPFNSPKWKEAIQRYLPKTQPSTLEGQYEYFRSLQDLETLAAEASLSYVQLNRTIERQNDQIRLFNDRVTRLLGEVNGTSREESPEYWWYWWKERIEVEPDQKFVREVHEQMGESLHLPVSCFVAGTPVWTDRGPRPIEQLNIGDMALTKDVETGHLDYRPIIRTTTRKPKPLVTIDLGAEQITSTGGHPFFVAGEGWVRARELKAGQMLHTPTGSIKIDSVTETPEDETFNLVIDGFHTYFVGMSQVLVHDVSITSPTDAIVPGLLDR